MAQAFAQIDSENRVKSTHSVSDDDCQDENGDISEAVGIAFLTRIHGHSAWKQMTAARGQVGKMYHYSTAFDLFYTPQPHASWTLDEAAGKWNPPIPFPSVLDYSYYYSPEDEANGLQSVEGLYAPTWDEINQRWISYKNLYPENRKYPIQTHINVWNPDTSVWDKTKL